LANYSFFRGLVDELNARKLDPVIDSVFDLADGRDAFERLASGRQFGKIVVKVAE
jgi:NADPH:quinone reductase-like Zn-dependent oxidoreductase